ncbi:MULTISPECIES: hypothetical protein [Pseudomonas syringae group]|uniref:hypothetical protein n=1 Tax=Pseudomonas syringae group TaxID=136849 RepID=UPI00137AC22B|nr:MULTISPECIES: hypothetical protein [Pseudomonas syringae group]MBF9243486.1 hypothetical protein [Pseudomonas syringae pv. tomato]
MDKAVIDLLKRRVIDSGKQRHGADSARTGNLRREVDGLAAAVRAARSRFPPFDRTVTADRIKTV